MGLGGVFCWQYIQYKTMHTYTYARISRVLGGGGVLVNISIGVETSSGDICKKSFWGAVSKQTTTSMLDCCCA